MGDHFAALDRGGDFLESFQFGLDGPPDVFGNDSFGDRKKVFGQVEVIQQFFGVFLDEVVVEKFLEDLFDNAFPVFDGFGLVVVEPGLF